MGEITKIDLLNHYSIKLREIQRLIDDSDAILRELAKELEVDVLSDFWQAMKLKTEELSSFNKSIDEKLHFAMSTISRLLSEMADY